MYTKSLGCVLGLFLVSIPLFASEGAENALPALPGYSVKVWAKGTADFTNPDSIELDRGHIWVGYQNVTSKTGGDGKYSTVVEYDSDGRLLRTFAVPGHCDGLRIDPATHTVWASSNEDGNPGLVSIDQTSGKITTYSFDATVHGGGFDDMAFLNGKMFIAASNPNLDVNGVNVFPAVDEVTFIGTKVVLTPVLMGNGSAIDTISGSAVTLNEVDPDSMSVDASGNLVLVNQAGSELVFIKNPGTASQSVSRTLVGTQLEDTVWIKSAARGRLLVVDGNTNTVYSVKTKFAPGTIYTETPNDSGVSSFVGTLDPATGIIKPVVIGFSKATGLIFVPGGDDD
jgi:sugar lactone lactonase YvrE